MAVWLAQQYYCVLDAFLTLYTQLVIYLRVKERGREGERERGGGGDGKE